MPVDIANKPEFIARMCKKLNLNPRQVADVFGGSSNTFSRYETGRITPPRPRVLLFVARDKHPELIDEVC